MKNLILVGSYGSGKTQLAINIAIDWQQRYKDDTIALIDLDVVNPYFRSREMAEELEARGIIMVLPQKDFVLYEAPALPAAISTKIKDKNFRTILDVGGDLAGSKVLGRYHQEFESTDSEAWMVINTYRPGTSSCGEIIQMIEDIEVASRIKIKGLINNTNLGLETTPEVIIEGYRIIEQVSKKTQLPIVMTTVHSKYFKEVKKLLKDDMVFTMNRYLQTPWNVEG